MAKQQIPWLMVVIIAGLGYLAFVGNPFAGEDTTTVPPGTTPPVTTCDSTTTPGLTISALDIESPGTALTETTNLLRKKNGGDAWVVWQQGNNENMTSLELDSTYEFIMGIDLTNSSENSYGPYFTWDVPCKETSSETKKLYQDGNTSITWFNDNDQPATAVALSNDESKVVSFKIRTASSNQAFGNPFIKDSGLSGATGQRAAYPNVICWDVNGTAFDKFDFFRIQGGEDMKTVGKPQRHDPDIVETQSVGITETYCYEFPIVLDDSMYFELGINTDDTAANNPSADTYEGVVGHLYAANFFIDGDTNLPSWGIEDEDGNVVGVDMPDYLNITYS